jgi:uncharacterized protein (DUF1501 family)
MRRWNALAADAEPHFLVVMLADGGWDPIQVLDVHDPLDDTDGVDVDVPTAISGLPPSAPRTVGGLTYMSNPTTRPNVDAYFDAHAGRSAILNGFATHSTSHSQSTQLTLTGSLDPTRADFAVMAAHHNGVTLPLPHLLVSGASFGGAYSGLSGRLGGQMRRVLEYSRLDDGHPAVSALGEAYIQQALEYERLLDEGAPPSAISGKLPAAVDAKERADKLSQLASTLNINDNDGATLATSLGAAFRSGLTTSVTLNAAGGFDTHNDNTQQNARWDGLFMLLNGLLTGLAAEPGIVRPNMLQETTVVVCSDFSRTPLLNMDNGKDHHPWGSMLLAGKRVHGGITVGMTDDNQDGVKVNLATGRPNQAGIVPDVSNVVAGLVTLMGANSSTYLPGVLPYTAFIA